MLDVSAIRQYLESVKNGRTQASLESVVESLVSLKIAAVAAGDQEAAKQIWCLQESLRAQTLFLSAFELMKSEAFYEAWCELERVELALSFLERHNKHDWQKFHLDFIHEYIPKWQSLFPYKLFLSPEYLHHEEQCSICGAVVTSPRVRCGHEVGEIYNGEMCCRVVTKAEFLAAAVVENPVQKYSVPFAGKPDASGNRTDHYNYGVVWFAVNGVSGPFDPWSMARTTRLQPHSRFRRVGRNEPCPCESKRKYKKCCLNKAGVERPHVEFTFSTPPSHLPPEIYLD